jgi:segregation and condensation protein A
MDATELLKTITHLIDQAERGEIDPWNVQVIEVIDRYLELMTPDTTVNGHESDLSQSGQAFLSASMLILFKANTLTQLSIINEIEESIIDDATLGLEDGVITGTDRLQLERQLTRRPIAMPLPKRRVTLPELIEQLHIMANQLKLVEKCHKPERVKRQSSAQSLKEALELAHQENLTQVAVELEQVLHLAAGGSNLSEHFWSLEQLVQLWTQTKPPETPDAAHNVQQSHLISVFWALLLLSAQSKVELFQQEFYQEIQIRLPEKETALVIEQID